MIAMFTQIDDAVSQLDGILEETCNPSYFRELPGILK